MSTGNARGGRYCTLYGRGDWRAQNHRWTARVTGETMCLLEVGMDTEFAAYLDRVRAHRAELRDSVAAVEEALASPIARGGAWRDRVRAALAELSHDFEDHVRLTEGPGGLYDSVRRGDPRLTGQVARLMREHQRYREDIGGYLTILEHGGTMADLPLFREELTTLVGQLVRHRQRGADLVYEAYDVDLGGSG